MDLTGIEIIPFTAEEQAGAGKDPMAMVGATFFAMTFVVAVILLLHGLVRSDAVQAVVSADDSFEYIEARLLKKGEIKDDAELPDRIVPPQATAPEEVIALDKKEDKPEPAEVEPKEEKPQPDAVADDQLRKVFERARAFAEIQDNYVPEGHPDGVEDGDVTDPALANMGATYGRQITRYIQERWIVPDFIKELELKKLKAKVLLKFNDEMTIVEYKVLKKSNNKYFDDSVANAIERTQKEVRHLPKPPDEIAAQIYGGGLVMTLHGDDAPQ